jgi:type II secretory pathway component GspD/PulD (secretin)
VQQAEKVELINPQIIAKGTVNIVSARPVPRELSDQILLSSLRMQGFSAVEGDGVIKIVPEADAKLHARVAATYPVEQVKQAIAAAAGGERDGKILIGPA